MSDSLRKRLLVTLLLALAVLWSFMTLATWVEARRELRGLLDSHLARSAGVLMSLVHHELHEHALGGESPKTLATDVAIAEMNAHLDTTRKLENTSFQVQTDDGRYTIRSANIPRHAFAGAANGFSNVTRGVQTWRVYTLHDPEEQVLVRVAEHSPLQEALVGRLAGWMILPALAGLPLMALLISAGVSRALRPLDRLTGNVKRMVPARLGTLDEGSAPAEVRPLVTAFNHLLARLRRLLEDERRFAGDAAHELRSPLSVIKTHAQVAGEADAPDQRERALARIDAGVANAEHLVTQLLSLARVEADAELGGGEALDLGALTQQIMAEIAPCAMAKDIELELSEQGPSTIPGNRIAVTMLIRNLLDNAIRYTPHDGRVTVAVATAGDEVLLKIADSGPGIAEGLRARVFDRFYRGRGNPATGSGLGLSIVRRVAELCRATVRLGTAGNGGLEVEVRFPITP